MLRGLSAEDQHLTALLSQPHIDWYGMMMLLYLLETSRNRRDTMPLLLLTSIVRLRTLQCLSMEFLGMLTGPRMIGYNDYKESWLHRAPRHLVTVARITMGLIAR